MRAIPPSAPTSTADNWVRSVDPHLYLYLTGEPHTLTVGTATVKVEWTGSGFAYEITNAAGEVIGSGTSGGGSNTNRTETPDETAETEAPVQTTVTEGTATTTVNSESLSEQLEGADAGTQIVIKPDIPEDETIHTAVTILAMLVTVLHRLEDTPDTAVKEVFGDVPAGTWYTDSVHWANENGIVYGMGNGVFAPDNSITREQMVVMMYRYSDFLGLDVSERDDLGSFRGTGELSDWAIEAMQWAVSAGLIEGKEDGALDPQGTATRAEVAAILQRFISLLVK